MTGTTQTLHDSGTPRKFPERLTDVLGPGWQLHMAVPTLKQDLPPVVGELPEATDRWLLWVSSSAPSGVLYNIKAEFSLRKGELLDIVRYPDGSVGVRRAAGVRPVRGRRRG